MAATCGAHWTCSNLRPEHASGHVIDPLGFDAGDSNLYRYVNNTPISITDSSGLQADSESLADYLKNAPTSLKNLVTNANNLEGALLERVAGRLKRNGAKISGRLTGDIFDKGAFNYFNAVGANEKTILLTINGILTNDAGADAMLASVKRWNVGPNAKAAIPNGTHGLIGDFGFRDFVQIGLNEIGIADLTSIRAAIQIEIAAETLRQKVPNAADRTIVVVAHSQGTMVLARAMRFLSPETKSMIEYYGNGGQAFIPINGLKAAKNYYFSNDLVPAIASNSKIVKQALQSLLAPDKTYNVYNLGLGGNKNIIPNISAHAWNEYAKIYAAEPQGQLPGNEVLPYGKMDLVDYPRRSLFQKVGTALIQDFNALLPWNN